MTLKRTAAAIDVALAAVRRRKQQAEGGEPLNAFSKKRWDKVTAAGHRPTTTFTPKPRETKTKAASAPLPQQRDKPRKDTGPKTSQRQRVYKRSGGMCEWPGCPEHATDVHHRLNRKDGGRHGQMRERINGAAWLLHVCRFHHERVTSAFGAVLAEAKAWGWVLTEGQNALQAPVRTRHDADPIWLINDGSFLLFTEACA